MRKSVLAALVIGVLALSGCAQIPTDSAVQVGSDIQSTVTSDYTYYSPNGPSKGDGQSEILNGFINAFTGPKDDYLVAREFLTSKLASTWSPTQNLYIENSRPVISYQGTAAATVVVQAAANVDEQGRYTTFTSPESHTLKFEFAKENGQWRISSAPNATILVRPVFDVLFQSYNLYFYDQQMRYLIPDLRWFPTRPSTGTRLVSALLAGPSPWLSKAAHNSFPNGTKLSLESVPITDGTAVVDLNAAAAKATTDQLQHMLAQLNATLTQVTSVYGTVIRIVHAPQSISELPYRLALSTNTIPYQLGDGTLGNLSGANSVEAASPQAKALQATDFAVNNENTLVAYLNSNGVSVVKNYKGATVPTLVDGRPNLLRPAIDPQGYTFSLGSGKASVLRAFDRTGRPIFAFGGWLTQYDHVSFAISKEGSRLAVVLRNGAQTSLYSAAIIRDYQGVPIGIGDPLLLSNAKIVGNGIGWIGENSVGFVSAVDGLVTTPTIVTIGGDTKTLTAIAGAVEFVASSTDSTQLVLDSHGAVLELRGFTWQLVKTGVKQLHF